MGSPTPAAGSIVTQPWLETEVHDLWTLSSEELALLPGMTDKGRLGFAVQLKFMQLHGRFPEQHTEIDLKIFNAGLATNPKVRLRQKGKSRIGLTPLATAPTWRSSGNT